MSAATAAVANASKLNVEKSTRRILPSLLFVPTGEQNAALLGWFLGIPRIPGGTLMAGRAVAGLHQCQHRGCGEIPRIWRVKAIAHGAPGGRLNAVARADKRVTAIVEVAV